MKHDEHTGFLAASLKRGGTQSKGRGKVWKSGGASAPLGSTAPAKYWFYATPKVCMQARQGFGSSEFAQRGAACKISDKLNLREYVNFLFVFPRVARSGASPVPSLWWWTMFHNLIFHNLIAVTGLGGLKKLQQTGYWEAASRILGSLKKGKCGLFEGGGY